MATSGNEMAWCKKLMPFFFSKASTMVSECRLLFFSPYLFQPLINFRSRPWVHSLMLKPCEFGLMFSFHRVTFDMFKLLIEYTASFSSGEEALVQWKLCFLLLLRMWQVLIAEPGFLLCCIKGL